MKTIFIQAALIAAAFAVPGTTTNENAASTTSGTGNPNATDVTLDERSYQRISFKACYQRSWAVRCCGYGSGRHRYHCQDGKLLASRPLHISPSSHMCRIASRVHDSLGNEHHFCEWHGYNHGPFCCSPKLVFKHHHYTNMCDHLIVPQIQSKEWEYVELWRNGSWPVNGFPH